MANAIGQPEIRAVYDVIRPHIRVTPVAFLRGEDFGLSPFDITLKLEHLQHAGAFKVRGAFANLLLRPIPAAGVAAASGGNHGVAVACAARRRGVPARIFVPRVSSPAKTSRIRGYGADLEIVGERYADALEACEAWVSKSGALPIHAFDDLETILGQGTLALELEEQAPGLDTILAPVGGGGLISGIAAWYAGRAQVVGVEPEEAPTLTAALRAGEPVDAPAGGLAADSLAPRRIGKIAFPIARDHVARVLLVSDAAIARAQQELWSMARLAVEPGGATAFAALLSGAYAPRKGERVAVILSGGNTHLSFPDAPAS